MSASKFMDRVISNHGKYLSSYNDQLLCCMYFDKVMKLFKRSPKIGKNFQFLKECVGNRNNPIDPMEMSLAFSPRQQSTEVFNTFNNAQLTSLTPLVEMFVKNETDNSITPIPLQNVHNKLSMFSNQGDTYSFLGLKEINIDLKGDSFETRKRDIDISIIFYANNLNVFNENGNGKIYIPLIHPFHKNKGNRFRLMLRTGWNNPSPATKESLFFRKEDKPKLEAIKKQKIVYELQYTKHTFNFNEDGSFTIQVDYVSSVEDSLYDISYTDISDEEIKDTYPFRKAKKISGRREKQIDDYIRENHPAASTASKTRIYNYFASDPELIDERIANKKESIQSRNTKIFHDMINLLKSNNCVYTVAAKKSIVQNEMFVRAVNAASFAEGEDAGYSIFRQPNLRKLYLLQEELTGLTVPSAAEGGQSFFKIEDYNKTFTLSRGVLDHEGDTRMFYIARVRKNTKVLDYVSKLSDYEDERMVGSDLAHPAIWRVFEVYKLGDVLNAFIASSPNSTALERTEIALGSITISGFSKCYPALNRNAVGSSANPQVGQFYDRAGFGLYQNLDVDAGIPETHPLYDIPITYQMLQRIVAENFAATTRNRLTYFHFFNSLMSRVVRPYFLEGDPALQAGQATTKGVVRTYQKSIPRSSSVERQNVEGLKRVFNPTSLPIEKLKQVHITYCGPAASKTSSSIDIYRIGSAGSVIKSVQFSQANTGIEKARATDNAAATYRNGKSELIPQLYNVQMEIVGNLSFYPGYIFDLRPAMIGVDQQSQAIIFRTLGLLGKYFTTHVQHKIGMEGFSTKILKAYNFGAQDPQ